MSQGEQTPGFELAATLPASFVKRFSTHSEVLLQLLWNRGILTKSTTAEELEAFLGPQYELGRHDPLQVPNMEAAVKRVFTAIEAGERITVYGDYDADGVPGTALLYEALSRLGAEVDHFIPA